MIPTTMRLGAAAAAALLAGCASFSPDGGFEDVSRLVRERTGQTPALQRDDADAAVAARRAELLARPLTADGAVELAFLGNRGLQASFAQLGIAEADLVRAGRLRNPSFGFGRLAGGGAVEIDRSLVFDVLGLLTMPLATQVEQHRFEQAQLRAADAAVGLAAEVRAAYVRAVAAQQLVRYAQQVIDAADASAELAARMAAVGNLSELARLREQAFRADATAQLARGRQRALAERERLVRRLGLTDPAGLRLPERLPDLPAAALEPHDAERTALDRRLDVLIAKRSAEATARSLGLTRTTRLVDVLEAGWQNQAQSGEPGRDGVEIRLELPLFDFGQARVARAEATYRQALGRVAQTAVDARSEVRETLAAYRTAWDVARHYRDEVVPLRKRISEENLLRYNGMLIDVFELLADAREQVAGVTGAIEALRDFWLADADLRTALTGHAPGERALPPGGAATPAAAD